MKPLSLIVLLFITSTVSAQTAVTIAELEKFMKTFDDTTAIITALRQLKDQIIKTGFTFTGTPTDGTDYKVSVYTKRFTDMSDIEIQLKEQKGSYIVSFHFRTLEIKAIDQ